MSIANALAKASPRDPEFWYEARSKAVADRIGVIVCDLFTAPAAALDVGAGDGSITELLQSNAPHVRFSALEPDENFYSGKHHAASLDSRWVQGSCFKLPFKSETFDVVTFLSVFEHLLPGSRPKALREIWRVLRPGGYLVGEIPNAHFPIEVHSQLPMINFLPSILGAPYFRYFAPIPLQRRKSGIFWFRATLGNVMNEAREANFTEFRAYGAAYHPGVLPRTWRWAAGLQRVLPPVSYDFLCRKSTASTATGV